MNMFTKQESEVMKSIIEYHLKEVKQDKKLVDVVAVLGAEEKYEHVLKEILKKLK